MLQALAMRESAAIGHAQYLGSSFRALISIAVAGCWNRAEADHDCAQCVEEIYRRAAECVLTGNRPRGAANGR